MVSTTYNAPLLLPLLSSRSTTVISSIFSVGSAGPDLDFAAETYACGLLAGLTGHDMVTPELMHAFERLHQRKLLIEARVHLQR